MRYPRKFYTRDEVTRLDGLYELRDDSTQEVWPLYTPMDDVNRLKLTITAKTPRTPIRREYTIIL